MAGGYYVNGTNYASGDLAAAWWSSGYSTPQRRMYLQKINVSSAPPERLRISSYWLGSIDGRYDGFFVRCVARL